MVYLLVLVSVVAMSGSQLLLKKGLLQVGEYPRNIADLGSFLLRSYTNGYVIGAVLLTIVTALAWLLALTRAELSHIYPFMALSYFFVALFSLIIFKEDVNPLRWAGIAVICIGVALVSRS